MRPVLAADEQLTLVSIGGTATYSQAEGILTI
jgi:hypothetical protein